MRPDRGSWIRLFLPFPFFLDIGVGIVDELTDISEGLSPPIHQLLDPLVDVRRSGFLIQLSCWFHVLSDAIFSKKVSLCDMVVVPT